VREDADVGHIDGGVERLGAPTTPREKWCGGAYRNRARTLWHLKLTVLDGRFRFNIITIT
jgi:hypothetical protein